ncbi:MAG: dihydrofolate reductase [Bacillota bacterium]
MNCIVAVDEHWGIGYENDLLFPIKKDLQRFKELTTGQVVVLGRKTLDSLPNGKPLPNRHHIVLTKNQELQSTEQLTVCHSLDELLIEIKKWEATKEVFLIGGGIVYNLLLPYCSKAYITKIEKKFPADTFFQNLDEDNNWVLKEQSQKEEERGVGYTYCLYHHSSILSF